MEVLIGSQNNLFLWFWWAKQLILFDLGGKTVYFVVIKWDLTNLTNFWRTWLTSDELDELLTNFWQNSDERGELLTNLANLWGTWRTSDVVVKFQPLAHVLCFFVSRPLWKRQWDLTTRTHTHALQEWSDCGLISSISNSYTFKFYLTALAASQQNLIF